MEFEEIQKELDHVDGLNDEEFRSLQLQRLKDILAHHYENSEFYRKFLDDNGVSLSDIQTLDDIRKLPVMDGEHVSHNFPLTSVPVKEVKRFLQTSGTSGKPKLIAYNKEDQERVAVVKARALMFSGVKKHDVFLSVMNYGPWASGLISQQGGELIGLTIPADAKLGLPWHLWAIETYKPDYAVCLVSFLPRLLEECKKQGTDPKTLGIKKYFVLGEISSNNFRDHFSKALDAEILDMYASTEFACMGSSCSHGSLHYWGDEVYIEILNPKTKEPCKPGEKGEIVITGLTKKSMPLVRYNTKDLGYVYDSRCECGSAFPRMSHILGRSDHMITVAGANAFPMQIEKAITSIPELSHLYHFIIDKQDFKDKITIKAELSPDAMAQTAGSSSEEGHSQVAVDHDALKQKILENVVRSSPELDHAINQAKVLHEPEIHICNPGELSGGKWKIQKIFDNREIDDH